MRERRIKAPMRVIRNSSSVAKAERAFLAACVIDLNL